MTGNQVTFSGINIALADGWFDVTDDLPEGSPNSLAKPHGVGVVQISTATYRAGRRPRIDCDALKDLLYDFCESNKLGRARNIQESAAENSIVSGDFVDESEFTRIWYVSDGVNVAFVTYVSLQGLTSSATRSELDEAHTMIHSIKFAASRS